MSGRHLAREARETCKWCGSAPEEGRTMCEVHLAHRREEAAELRAARKRKHLCVTCGVKAKPGKTLCEKHLAYYVERIKKYRAS